MRCKFSYRKFHLKEWLGMQAHLSTIHAAAKAHSPDVPDAICRFLAAALDSEERIIRDLPWTEAIDAMDQVVATNNPSWVVPMLRPHRGKPQAKEPWLYIGGEWYRYLHVFSSKYQWSEEYIADLEIEKAFALMQEIAVDEQLQKEWEFSLSERAIVVDEHTRKARLQPLPRPEWMRPEIKMPKKVVIPKSMLPVGEITIDPRLLDITNAKNTEPERDV